MVVAARTTGIPLEEISFLTVGIAAPLLAFPLMWMWLERKLSYDELAAAVIRTVAFGCRDQNARRTRESRALLN